MLVIMIGGPARVGKTTLARTIGEYAYNEGYTPIILPFAYLLKEEATAKGYSKDTNPEEYRLFCQTLGSEMRNKDSEYWIKKFKDKLKFIYEEEKKALNDDPSIWHEKVIIVDDCRYMNEVAAARDLRALSIFVSAGDRLLIDAHADWRSHESEHLATNIELGNKEYQDVFDYFLKNDKPEAEFKKKAKSKMAEWFEILSENLVGKLCTCELCLASREDRPPDPDKVTQHILEMFQEGMDDD